MFSVKGSTSKSLVSLQCLFEYINETIKGEDDNYINQSAVSNQPEAGSHSTLKRQSAVFSTLKQQIIRIIIIIICCFKF